MTSNWLSVCETGGCLEIQVQGDTVVLRETSTPDVEVVTPLASWQAWQDKARAEERAAIVAAITAERDRWTRLGYDDSGAWVAAVRIASGGVEKPAEIDSEPSGVRRSTPDPFVA